MVNKSCLTQEEIKERLKTAGINPTTQRVVICQYVLCDADHPTAEEVKAWTNIHFPSLSLATVYNTLNVLVEAGLLKEFRFPHSDKVIYDNNVLKHYHFIDQQTGKLVDICPTKVNISAELPENLKPADYDVLITGENTKIIRTENTSTPTEPQSSTSTTFQAQTPSPTSAATNSNN